jgi:hypothetical protein
MNYSQTCFARIKQSIAAAIFMGACASPLFADPGNDNRAPQVPSGLEVPVEGAKVSFHVYAVGVQIYTWNGSSWGTSVPSAVLFDADGNVVGVHSAGPTWETESGSKVVGSRINGLTVNPTAIPWLLLKAKTADGPGVLDRTSYIQRVNTVGGLPPATPGATVGDVAKVAYTAEYFFFRSPN